MYAHPIATLALCEAYGMSLDPGLKKSAQAALNYIVTGQGKDGSWGYSHGANGDTSIVGWNVQALHAAKLAGLNVPEEALKNAGKFLDKVQSNSGATYGYSTPGASRTLTPVGLLLRQYTGWGPKNPILGKGVDYLKTQPPPANPATAPDMYYYYYATQVVHFYGGPDWTAWNIPMRDGLIKTQVAAKGPNYGSWDADPGSIGSHCGRLGTTAMALLTLEVYYRHLPLYKRDNGGLNELER